MFEEFREDILKVLEEAGIQYKESSKFFTIRCVNPAHPDRAGKDMKFYKDSGRAYCFACKTSLNLPNFAKYVGNHYIPEYKKRTTQENTYNFRDLFKTYSGVSLPKGFTLWTGGHKELKISEDMVSIFNIGYCDHGFDKEVDLRKCSGCSCSNWVSSEGICNFAHLRILTPIMRDNKILSIEARDLSKTASKKVVYPSHSKPSFTIFNYDRLDKNKPLYVVEGIKSCLRIYSSISRNVTAIFSNLLKGEQADLIKEFKEVVVIPDIDRAGEETIMDLKKLDLPCLGVVRLPKKLVCKNCGNVFEGEKGTICPKCESTYTNYKDAFDYSDRELKYFISKKEIFGEPIIDKIEKVCYNLQMTRGKDVSS